MKPHHKQPTLLSLFAGAGGLDLGLESSGFLTLAANDVETHACETLRANQILPSLSELEFDAWFAKQLEQRCHGNLDSAAAKALCRRINIGRKKHHYLAHAKVLSGDIRELSSESLAEAAGVKRGELTLVAGGPPCQPFSRAGKRKTVDVEDGRLFLEFVRVVDDLRPRWFLFENVKGLLLSNTVVVATKCHRCDRSVAVPFDDREKYLEGAATTGRCPCGNTRAPVTVETKKGGSLDIIIAEFERLGYRTHVSVLNAADFGAPQLRERILIVGSRDGEKFTAPQPTHSSESAVAPSPQLPLFAPGASGRRRLLPHRTMLDALWRDGHPVYGQLDPKTAVLWVKNVVRPHAEPVTWSLDRPSPTIGAHQAAKLALAPHGVPEAQLQRQQWHLKGRRQGDHPPVHVTHEYLSDVELLTLQTFPPEWYLYGTRMQRAFQIGNAVPVVLGAALGEALLGRHAPSPVEAGLTREKGLRLREAKSKAGKVASGFRIAAPFLGRNWPRFTGLLNNPEGIAWTRSDVVGSVLEDIHVGRA